MSYKFTKPNIYDITKLCVLIYKNLLRPNTSKKFQALKYKNTIIEVYLVQ